MIFVTKLNGEQYLINSRLIETAERKPDTTLTMTSGKKVIVQEPLEVLQQKIVAFERQVVDGKLESKTITGALY